MIRKIINGLIPYFLQCRFAIGITSLKLNVTWVLQVRELLLNKSALTNLQTVSICFALTSIFIIKQPVLKGLNQMVL